MGIWQTLIVTVVGGIFLFFIKRLIAEKITSKNILKNISEELEIFQKKSLRLVKKSLAAIDKDKSLLDKESFSIPYFPIYTANRKDMNIIKESAKEKITQCYDSLDTYSNEVKKRNEARDAFVEAVKERYSDSSEEIRKTIINSKLSVTFPQGDKKCKELKDCTESLKVCVKQTEEIVNGTIEEIRKLSSFVILKRLHGWWSTKNDFN